MRATTIWALTESVYRVVEHGEMSIEVVDALEVYGNALLKNAIASSAVLGDNAGGQKGTSEEAGQKKSKEGVLNSGDTTGSNR